MRCYEILSLIINALVAIGTVGAVIIAIKNLVKTIKANIQNTEIYLEVLHWLRIFNESKEGRNKLSLELKTFKRFYEIQTFIIYDFGDIEEFEKVIALSDKEKCSDYSSKRYSFLLMLGRIKDLALWSRIYFPHDNNAKNKCYEVLSHLVKLLRLFNRVNCGKASRDEIEKQLHNGIPHEEPRISELEERITNEIREELTELEKYDEWCSSFLNNNSDDEEQWNI